MSALVSVADLTQALGSGRLTALELAKDTLNRIHAQNGQLRAFISISDNQALEAAEASDRRRASGHTLGPLDGVPVAVKDNIEVKGVPTTNGTDFYRNRIAEQDAFVVNRLRAAGAVVVGTLNMHECALGATTNNPFWGRCENPAAPGHTPGGSSGGSAAAVAAGLVPIALGTDTMGSTRIPAAYCGIWGMKPTRGLVSAAGLQSLSWTLDTIGPMAANADDLLLAFQTIAGHDPDHPDSCLAPHDWQGAGTEPADDEIVLGIPDFASIVECEPAVLDATARLQERLSSAGIKQRPVTVPSWNPGALRRAGLLVSEAELGSLIAQDLDSGGDGFSSGFRALIDYGRNVKGERLAAAYRQLHLARFAARQAMEGVDAILLPTAPQRAFVHRAPVPANQADFTALANVAGLPAVAFPIAAADGGLPASCQLMGHPFSDSRLIALARRLERL